MRSHEIRYRIVVGPEGRRRTALVYCPYRCHVVALELHMHCDYGQGVEKEGTEEVACCGRPGVEALPPLAPTPSGDWRAPAPGCTCSSAARVAVCTLMSQATICVSPDLALTELHELLLSRAIGGSPVVEEDGTLLGVVSKTDLLRHLAEATDPRDDEPATVADVMTPFAYRLPDTAPVSQAAAYMAYKRIHRLAIVSASGQLVGVLSSLDVMRWLGEHDGYVAT